MKIYTKFGDKGMTKLVDGSSVDKSNDRVEAYGKVDELNSYIGLIRSELVREAKLLELDEKLDKIQNDLFNVGSLLATESSEVALKLPVLNEKHVEQLENWIDLFSSELPPLKNFVLPGGHLCASHLHVARTICRNAERKTSALLKTTNHVSLPLVYLNRLSDLLFTWARWCNLKCNHPEVLWKK